MTEEKPKSKKINDLEALLTLTKSTNYAIPILDLNDRDADGDPKLKQVPINLLQSLFQDETNLHKVATTGKYSDLKNLPQLFSGNYADLSGKPELFSGVYGDLQNKPDLSQFLTQHQDISGKADKSEVVNTMVKTYSDVFAFRNYNGEGGYNFSIFPAATNTDFYSDINKLWRLKDSRAIYIPAILQISVYGYVFPEIPLLLDLVLDNNFRYWKYEDQCKGALARKYDSETGVINYYLELQDDLTNQHITSRLTLIYSGLALELLNTVEQ